jgi:hypothetical protein
VKGRVLKENSKMKSKERKLMLMECINENLNSVIINQERIYCQLVEMMKKMDKLEKDQNVIIKTEPVKNK